MPSSSTAYIYVRSLTYAGIVTVLCARRSPTRWPTGSRSTAGRRKSVYLFLLLLPFFVSFIIRTVQWQFLLSDDGLVLGTAEADRSAAGELPRAGHVDRGDRRASPTTSCRSWRCRSTSPSSGSTSGCVEAGNGPVRQQVHDVPQGRVPLALPGVFAGVPADVRAGASATT